MGINVQYVIMNSKIVRFTIGNLFTLLIILYISSKYERSEPIIAPYGLLMLAIVITTAIGGLYAGLVSASLVSGFTIYSNIIGFDPTLITSHPLNSFVGIVIFYTQSLVLGSEKLRRDLTVAKLEKTKDLLEEEIINKETKLEIALENAMLVEKGNTLGQFATGISHDFNNILQTIMSLSELTLLQVGRDSAEEKAFQDIIYQTELGAKLIQQIFDFTRKSTSESEIIELNQFLQKFTEHSQRMLNRQIEISFIPSDPILIEFDTTHLNQVLLNLIANAKDAIKQTGKIEIRLVKNSQKNTGMISISDSGKGIPPDILPKIFEPYVTTKNRSEGTGLGLAQVWGLIHKHNGEIAVQSKINQGTTFNITLPIAEK